MPSQTRSNDPTSNDPTSNEALFWSEISRLAHTAVARVCFDRGIREDVAQEALARIYGSYDPHQINNPKALVDRTVRNVSINMSMSNRARRDREYRYTMTAGASPLRPDFVAQTEAADVLQRMADTIGSSSALHPTTRDNALLMLQGFHDGATRAEIAADHDIPAGGFRGAGRALRVAYDEVVGSLAA